MSTDKPKTTKPRTKQTKQDKPRGRGKLKAISTPEDFWKHFTDYKKKTKKNPKKVEDWVGGMAKKVVRKREVPLTMDGFENYMADLGIITDMSDYFENKDGRYADYVPICSRVKREIRQDHIEGGMTNLYNASITQRLNGLVEKGEVVVREQPFFGDDEQETGG
jgi:hypothetical protein